MRVPGGNVARFKRGIGGETDLGISCYKNCEIQVEVAAFTRRNTSNPATHTQRKRSGNATRTQHATVSVTKNRRTAWNIESTSHKQRNSNNNNKESIYTSRIFGFLYVL